MSSCTRGRRSRIFASVRACSRRDVPLPDNGDDDDDEDEIVVTFVVEWRATSSGAVLLTVATDVADVAADVADDAAVVDEPGTATAAAAEAVLGNVRVGGTNGCFLATRIVLFGLNFPGVMLSREIGSTYCCSRGQAATRWYGVEHASAS